MTTHDRPFGLEFDNLGEQLTYELHLERCARQNHEKTLDGLEERIDLALEETYRRGYVQGYRAATNDVKALGNRGFKRPREIANILLMHARLQLQGWWMSTSLSPKSAVPKLDRPSWPALRKKVLDRDGPVCAECAGLTGPFEIDHIQGVAEGGLPYLGNLRVLCGPCNRKRKRPRSEGAA